MSNRKHDYQSGQDEFDATQEHDFQVDNNESGDNVSLNTDSVSQSERAHKQLREAMAADVAAFLSQGGKIQSIEPNVMADPPRKPQTNYGSRPI